MKRLFLSLSILAASMSLVMSAHATPLFCYTPRVASCYPNPMPANLGCPAQTSYDPLGGPNYLYCNGRKTVPHNVYTYFNGKINGLTSYMYDGSEGTTNQLCYSTIGCIPGDVSIGVHQNCVPDEFDVVDYAGDIPSPNNPGRACPDFDVPPEEQPEEPVSGTE